MPISPPRAPSRPALTLRRAVLVLGVLVLLVGCQVQVEVDTVVDRTGAGTVTVAMGFDEEAWDRLAEHDPQIRMDDARQAGWQVTDAPADPNGVTWIRASKSFTSPDQLDAVLGEISSSMFDGFEFTRTETDDDITYRVTGEVDLSQGIATFADPEVAAQLGGDPFGGNIAAIEAEQGKPIGEMVSFEVTTSVAGGAPVTVHPSLSDTAPQAIDVSAVEVKPPPVAVRVAIGGAIVGGLVVVVVALVALRRRMHHGH